MTSITFDRISLCNRDRHNVGYTETVHNSQSTDCCHLHHSNSEEVDCICNVMAHSQKPDFVFRRNGWVHLNLRGRQFSRLLAAEVRASAVVTAGYAMFWGGVKSTGYPLHSPVSPSLPLPCITVCHHISTGLYFPVVFPEEMTNTSTSPNIPFSLWHATQLTKSKHQVILRILLLSITCWLRINKNW